MSAKIMGAVWELDLPRPEKTVLLAMADHADHDGENVRPSVELVAWKTDYDERQVRRIQQKLRERGILELVEDRRARHLPNVYRINLSAAPRKMPLERPGRMSGRSRTRAQRPGKMPDASGHPDVRSRPGIAVSDEPSVGTIIEPSSSNAREASPPAVLPPPNREEEEERKPARDEQHSPPLPDEHGADLTEALLAEVQSWPRRPPVSGPALLRILSGADAEAWSHPATGAHVPPGCRLAVLRRARGLLESGRSRTLKGALRYAAGHDLAQDTASDPLLPNPPSDGLSARQYWEQRFGTPAPAWMK